MNQLDMYVHGVADVRAQNTKDSRRRLGKDEGYLPKLRTGWDQGQEHDLELVSLCISDKSFRWG
jgi:hypothetical protein